MNLAISGNCIPGSPVSSYNKLQPWHTASSNWLRICTPSLLTEPKWSPAHWSSPDLKSLRTSTDKVHYLSWSCIFRQTLKWWSVWQVGDVWNSIHGRTLFLTHFQICFFSPVLPLMWYVMSYPNRQHSSEKSKSNLCLIRSVSLHPPDGTIDWGPSTLP